MKDDYNPKIVLIVFCSVASLFSIVMTIVLLVFK